MLKVKLSTNLKLDEVYKRADEASDRALFRAGGLIRTIAVRSIRKKRGPKVLNNGEKERPTRKGGVWKQAQPTSKPGSPPYTHAPKYGYRKRIRFHVNKRANTADIGVPLEDKPEAFMVHELGGKHRRKRYPKRPFMRPALEKAVPRLPQQFSNIL